MLLCFISIQSKNDYTFTSEVAWISNNQLLLTVNNEYHLINLNHQDLYKTKINIYWGK